MDDRRGFLGRVGAFTMGGAAGLLATSRPTLAQTSPSNYPYFNVKDFGATGGGSVNDKPAIDSAISAAAVNGGTVYFPQGTYLISSSISLPNWVALKGTGRGSEIIASPTFSSQQMFYAANGTGSMFGSRLEDLSLNANDVAGIVAVVIADAWQETCGAHRVVVRKFRNRGMLIRFGWGGASWTRLSEIELFGSSLGSGTGIDCQQVSCVGAFMLYVSGASICGDSAAYPLAVGIAVHQDSLIADTVHFEYCNYGINLGGQGHSSLRGITGSYNNVGDIVALESTFKGSVVLQAVNPNGATASYHDYGTGAVVTAPIPHFVVQKAATLECASPP